MPLLLISGLAGEAGRYLADKLRETGTAVVDYDLRRVTEGVVRRRLRQGPLDALTTLELAHGCVSCTVREDLLPLLRNLARQPAVRRIVVRLDEVMDPERVCWELRHVLVGDRAVTDDVEIEAVVTVLDAATWLADALGDDTLADRDLRGAPDDERTVAQLTLSQVEFADVLVLAGSAPDAWTAAKTGAVLARVAPSAPILDLSHVDSKALRVAVPPDARRGEPADPHGTLLHGQPPLDPDCGITVLTFAAQRPFHPERLHDAIDVLLDGVMRTRGRVWVASQPDVALWIESAGGGLGIGHAGPWLDSPDGPAWEDVSAERRTLASLRWHPVWGDRAQELVIVTHQAETAEIEQALQGALLTDAELADGHQKWALYPDPFGEWHEEPCDDDVTAPARHDVNTGTGKDDTP
ncbi:hypothetical protein Atai01_14120 [Amycolatopsis taiwanensis]|uniref:CobW C-terminal domain-containing protein n=1 Tax=Amycolatopsis taiwanensis TaxID=342230 RepID=A0A9W6VBC3_9PSEU|nr:hypothetical protein Atai01_14120 [Amycolatopsis taiwanensis]